MAFTTTSQLNGLLLRGLQFRTDSNAPISSYYGLYADGRGGTFWAQAVLASDLSTAVSSIDSEINALQLNQVDQYNYMISSVAYQNLQITNIQNDFLNYQDSVDQQLSTFYQSTVDYANSTVYGFSTSQVFIDQVSTLNNDLQSTASTLYSTLSSYDNANFSTLSSYISESLSTSVVYTDATASSLSTSITNTVNNGINTFSTSINNALLSTSAGLVSTVAINNSSLIDYISTDTSLMNQAYGLINSTISTIDKRVSTLETASTGVSTFVYTNISTFVSTSNSAVLSANTSTFEYVFDELSILSTNASTAFGVALSSNSYTISALSTFSSLISQTVSTNNSLIFTVTLLTTSTLISSIYESFVNLEQFSADLVLSSYTSISTYTGESISTANSTLYGITDEYLSTIFDYLYSTAVSSVLIEVSTFSGELASTSFELYNSTVVSSSLGLIDEFESTSYGIYSSIFVGLNAQLDSSILAYVSVPTSEYLSTFDSLATIALDNFSTYSNEEISSFSSLYNSTLTEAGDAFNDFVTGLQNFVSSAALSTLYTEQKLTLSGSQSTAIMDLVNYRNFAVYVSDVNALSEYRLTFNSNNLLNMNWRSGTILIDILSTADYTYNDRKLVFDTYRWGLPTSIDESVFPYLSSADYTLMYDYRIYDSTIYTTLFNIYPRLRVYDLVVDPNNSEINVAQNIGSLSGYPYIQDRWLSTIFWRGSDVTINWSNYSYFPLSTLGAPPYAPKINVDLNVSGSLYKRYGPYDVYTSSATITLPYFTDVNNKVANVKVYFSGKIQDAISLSFNVLAPRFSQLEFYAWSTPTVSNFLQIAEIVGDYDNGETDIGSSISTNAYEYNGPFDNNLVDYGPDKMFDLDINTFYLGSNTVNDPIDAGYMRIFRNNPSNVSSLSSLTIFNTLSTSARGITSLGEMESTILRVYDATNTYYSTIILDASISQTFHF
jgi:hypothetical protein